MPNLLTHYGTHGLLTQGLAGSVAVRWILLGCVVPDVPWIQQRVLRAFSGSDLYTLSLYSSAQASLVGSLILCAALAVLAGKPRTVFIVLGLNVFLHLVIDGLQTKWAAGVHVLAPFTWRPVSVDLFWPESVLIYVLTGLGFVYLVVLLWRVHGARPTTPRWPGRHRWALAGALMAAYVVLPMSVVGALERADVHFVGTLRSGNARVGKHVEFDRRPVVHRGGDRLLVSIAREEILLLGDLPDGSGLVSVRGVFERPDAVRISESHRHHPHVRDVASYLGLGGLIGVWMAHWLSWRMAPSPSGVGRRRRNDRQ